MRALLNNPSKGKTLIEVESVEGNLPERIEIEGVEYSYCGIQDGFAYYTGECPYCGKADEKGILIVNPVCPVHNPESQILITKKECSREDGCGIPATVQSIYLGDSTSVRDENGLTILSREFSDGRKVEIRLDPEVLGNLIDWTIDKCSNSVILPKLDSMISNPPGLDGIRCGIGHIGNKYIDEGWKAGLEEFKKFLLAGKESVGEKD